MHVPMHVLQDRFIYAVFKVHSALQPLSFDTVSVVNSKSDRRLRFMEMEGLEPPTSRLSGVRSNRLSYKPIYFFLKSGSHLSSHTVASIVLSAA